MLDDDTYIKIPFVDYKLLKLREDHIKNNLLSCRLGKRTTINELKIWLKEFNLSTTGKRDVLMERYLMAIDPEKKHWI